MNFKVGISKHKTFLFSFPDLLSANKSIQVSKSCFMVGRPFKTGLIFTRQHDEGSWLFNVSVSLAGWEKFKTEQIFGYLKGLKTSSLSQKILLWNIHRFCIES